MQGSLRRFVDKSSAKPEQQLQQETADSKRKQKGGSMLVAALSCQLRRTENCEDALPLAQQAGAPAQLQTAAPLPLHELRFDLHASPATCQAQHKERQQQQQASASERESSDRLQPCPLCGQLLPLGEPLQEHVEQELVALESQGEEERCSKLSHASALPRAAGAGAGVAAGQHTANHQGRQQQQQYVQHYPAWDQQQQQQQGGRQVLSHRLQERRQQGPAPLLVLGGAPQLTAPTDRQRLQQLQRQRLLPSAKRQRQSVAPSEFNFYRDGGGTWAGEDIGLDGAGQAGIRWEGIGTSDF